VSLGGKRVAAAYTVHDRMIIIGDGTAELVLCRNGDTTTLLENSFDSQELCDYLWHLPLRQSVSKPPVLGHFDPRGLMRLRLIDAAALAGIGEVAVSMSVTYAGQRAQFGRPIGSFQAVQHHCANMAMSARRAHDQVRFAAVAFDEQRPDALLQIECALLTAAIAAVENSGKNIQVHGGIGFSDEAHPHLLLKRARLLIALAGGLEAVTERIALAAAA
jgi:hypothetical protein